jgi:hypothetical protein
MSFPKFFEKPSDIIMAFLLYTVLTPLLIFYAYTPSERIHLYTTVLGSLLVLAFSAGRKFKVASVKQGGMITVLATSAGAVTTTFLMFYFGGLKAFNLNFLEVYKYRAEVVSTFNHGILPYFITWATKVFGPILLTVTLWKKKYFLAALVTIMHILWFGLTSHKAAVFYPIVIIGFWFLFKSSKSIAIIPIMMTILTAILTGLFLLFDHTLLGSLLIRRALFVPASLTFSYFEFFSSNPFVYWSNSIMSRFLDYPYNLKPAELIGEYSGVGAWANNGFLSTGYMHAGIFGVFLYSLILGTIFRLINSLRIESQSAWLATSIVLIPSLVIIRSSDLLTGLLTHGLLLSVLFLWLYQSRSGSRGDPHL